MPTSGQSLLKEHVKALNGVQNYTLNCGPT